MISLKTGLKKKFFKLLKNNWPVLAIIISILVFFYPVWLRGLIPLPADIVVGTYFPWLDYKWGYPVGVPVKNPITSDAISFSFPMRMLAIDFMKSGQWPLWNPYILFGTPLLANFQSAPFSPTNFVYWIFDRLTAWSVQIMLQHLLAALFAFLLLRSWKTSNVGSTVGGLIFAFSGFNLIWSQWNAHTLTAAFIPLAIFFADKLGRGGRWWAGLGLSIALALQLLSGYPQLVLYSLAAVALFWFIVFWGTKEFLSRTVLLGIYILLGIGLASVQLLPGYELLSLSQRQQEAIPLGWVFLSWEQVITFIAPDFFGNHAAGNYWGPKNYTSVVGFVGVTSIILAGLAFSLWKKQREVKFLFLIIILSLLLAFPTPISLFLLQANPLGIQAGVSLRALVLFNFAIALLAGIGLDRLLKERGRISTLFSVLVPTLVLTGFLLYTVAAFILKLQDKSDLGVSLRNLILPFIALLSVWLLTFFFKRKFLTGWMTNIGLYAILLIELFYFGWKFTPFSPKHLVYPQTPVLDFLKSPEKPFRVEGTEVVPANLLIPYQLETASGYDAVYSARVAKLLAVINSGDSRAQSQDRYGIVTAFKSPLLNLLNVRYLLARSNKLTGFDPARFSLVFQDKSVAVLENHKALPRAFMVYGWEKEENTQKILDKLLDPKFPLGQKIILEEAVNVEQGSLAQSNVFYKSYGEQESILEVENQGHGLLFVADTWYPGWKAYIDGKEVKIYRADFAFMAVVIPAGEHKVKFLYHHDSFYNGLKISTISLSILGLIVFGRYLNLKKKNKYG